LTSRRDMSLVDEVADRVYRLGTEHINWYAVVDSTSVTVVDTGLPRYWPQLEALLTSLGRSVADIEAVLLTHADPDHLGNAERIAAETGATVFIHHADIPAVTKQVWISPPRVPPWRPAVLSFIAHGIRNGLLSWQAVNSPSGIEGDGQLSVPGRPTAIHTPGHTPGSVCYAFDDRDVLFVGDALLNKDPITGKAGCIVSTKGISADHARAKASISGLERLNHRTVLFGHGEPSQLGIQDVVRQARTT